MRESFQSLESLVLFAAKNSTQKNGDVAFDLTMQSMHIYLLSSEKLFFCSLIERNCPGNTLASALCLPAQLHCLSSIIGRYRSHSQSDTVSHCSTRRSLAPRRDETVPLLRLRIVVGLGCASVERSEGAFFLFCLALGCELGSKTLLSSR